MSQIDEDAKKITRMLLYVVDCINYYQTMSSCNDCNDCGKKLKCEYEPKAGEITRINCPLWEDKLNTDKNDLEKDFQQMLKVDVWPCSTEVRSKCYISSCSNCYKAMR